MPVGGLKLALEGVDRDDRRLRFARVSVASGNSQEELELVTDSQGRMRYCLAAGEYRVRLAAGGETRFTVNDGRWTVVRLRLP